MNSLQDVARLKAEVTRLKTERAQAVKDAYTAGFSRGQANVDKYGNTDDETEDDAFAAYLNRLQENKS